MYFGMVHEAPSAAVPAGRDARSSRWASPTRTWNIGEAKAPTIKDLGKGSSPSMCASRPARCSDHAVEHGNRGQQLIAGSVPARELAFPMSTTRAISTFGPEEEAMPLHSIWFVCHLPTSGERA